MKVLAITQLLPVSAIAGTLPNVASLVTPDPREAAGPSTTTAVRTIDIDLGSSQTVTTLFAGYGYGVGTAPTWTSSYGTTGYTDTAGPSLVPTTAGRDRVRHWIAYPSPGITARYIRINASLTVGATLGVIGIGGTIVQPQYGQEYGGGRFVVETGSADRLFAGGFGINDGARVGALQWTFGDLTDAEREALYNLQLAVGTTQTILVDEDQDNTSPNTLHWSLMTRLEAYERIAPNLTKWNLRVEDWL